MRDLKWDLKLCPFFEAYKQNTINLNNDESKEI
jgi:hypothetical protein